MDEIFKLGKTVEKVDEIVETEIVETGVDIVLGVETFVDEIVETCVDEIVETFVDEIVETFVDEIVETFVDEIVETVVNKMVETVVDEMVDDFLKTGRVEREVE